MELTYKASELNIETDQVLPQRLNIGKRVVEFKRIVMNDDLKVKSAIYEDLADGTKVVITRN